MARIRLITKTNCLFYGEKFLEDGKILNIITLLPGGYSLFVKYGSVWCKGEENSELS